MVTNFRRMHGAGAMVCIVVLLRWWLLFFIYKDIDECDGMTSECHHCQNTVGSFQCTCNGGYRLNTPTTCLGNKIWSNVEKAIILKLKRFQTSMNALRICTALIVIRVWIWKGVTLVSVTSIMWLIQLTPQGALVRVLQRAYLELYNQHCYSLQIRTSAMEREELITMLVVMNASTDKQDIPVNVARVMNWRMQQKATVLVSRKESRVRIIERRIVSWYSLFYFDPCKTNQDQWKHQQCLGEIVLAVPDDSLNCKITCPRRHWWMQIGSPCWLSHMP